jgi:hypothetical protein
MAKPLFLKHYDYLLEDPEIFDIFFHGTAFSTNENKQNDLIVITGKKGSGKTEIAKFLIHLYHTVLPKNKVIIFSGIPGLYKEFRYAINIDLKAVEEEEKDKPRTDMSGIPEVSEFANSLVVFDDTEKYPSPKVERMLYQMMNIIAQNGRNYNICMIVILHHLNKGIQSSTILREMDALIIFPHSYDRNTFNTLMNHYGLDKELVNFLYSNKGEKFILIRHTHPSYIFLGTSGKRIDL